MTKKFPFALWGMAAIIVLSFALDYQLDGQMAQFLRSVLSPQARYVLPLAEIDRRSGEITQHETGEAPVVLNLPPDPDVPWQKGTAKWFSSQRVHLNTSDDGTLMGKNRPYSFFLGNAGNGWRLSLAVRRSDTEILSFALTAESRLSAQAAEPPLFDLRSTIFLLGLDRCSWLTGGDSDGGDGGGNGGEPLPPPGFNLPTDAGGLSNDGGNYGGETGSSGEEGNVKWVRLAQLGKNSWLSGFFGRDKETEKEWSCGLGFEFTF